MKTVTQEDIRAIHSRLDVHKQAMTKLCLSMLDVGCNSSELEDVIEMLEESQNPFEVSYERRF